jgi:hypothetical protein
MAKRRTDNAKAKRKRTANTMAKRKRTANTMAKRTANTMVNKILLIKLKDLAAKSTQYVLDTNICKQTQIA